jgi:predicted Zn-dependent protease
MRTASFCAACLLLASVAFAGTSDQPEVSYFDRLDADVYFVPIGTFSREYLIELADYYDEGFGVRMGIAPALSFREGLYNADRKQLATEPVIAWMMAKYETYSTNPNAIFIGLTHNDLYMMNADFNFVFAQRIGENHAVISSRRVSPDAAPKLNGVKEVQPGLRKMVTKTIGLLHFKKPISDDPKSVMYGPVLNIDQLEAIDESTARSALLD